MRSENNGKVSEKVNDVSGTSSSDRVSEYLDDSNSQDQFILSIQLVFKTENGLEYFKDIFEGKDIFFISTEVIFSSKLTCLD